MNPLQLPSDVALLVVVEVLAPVHELGSRQPNRQARRVEQVPVNRRRLVGLHVDHDRQRGRTRPAGGDPTARGARLPPPRWPTAPRCRRPTRASRPCGCSSRNLAMMASLVALSTFLVATSRSHGRSSGSWHEPDLLPVFRVVPCRSDREAGPRTVPDRRDRLPSAGLGGDRSNQVGAARRVVSLDAQSSSHRRVGTARSFNPKTRRARKRSDGRK